MNLRIDGARKVGKQICAYTYADGGRYILKHNFPHRDCAELVKTLRAIREKGEINMTYWRPARKYES